MLAAQLVPYGHDLANPAARAELAATSCATGHAPGDAELTTVGDLQHELEQMAGHLNEALPALADGSLITIAYQVRQFSATYDPVRAELARLYPHRCAALDLARAQVEDALFRRSPSDVGATRLNLNALRASVLMIEGDLAARGATTSLAVVTPENSIPQRRPPPEHAVIGG